MPAPSAVRRRSARDGHARDAHAARRRGPLERADALVVRAPGEPQQAREQRREPERRSRPARRGRPGRARAARSPWCGRRRARTTPSRCRPARPRTRRGPRATTAAAATHVPTRNTTKRGDEQVAVRPDRQVDGHEVLPREHRAGGQLAEAAEQVGRRRPSRDGHGERDAEHEEGDREQRAATSQPPQRRRQATAAIAAATVTATADQEQRAPTSGRSARPRSPRSRRRRRRTREPATTRGDDQRPALARGLRHPASRSCRRSAQEQTGQVVERADGEHGERRQRLHARVGALVADHRDHGRCRPGRRAPPAAAG